VSSTIVFQPTVRQRDCGISIAQQLPMMSDRIVVRIRDFAKLREADEEVIIRYLKRRRRRACDFYRG